MKKLRLCKHCQKNTVKSDRALYCSVTCRDAGRKAITAANRQARLPLCKNGCGKRVQRPAATTCSRECAAQVRSRASYAKTAHVVKYCEACGEQLHRKWSRNGMVETLHVFLDRKTCNADCSFNLRRFKSFKTRPPEPAKPAPRPKSERFKSKPLERPILEMLRQIIRDRHPELGEEILEATMKTKKYRYLSAPGWP